MTKPATPGTTGGNRADDLAGQPWTLFYGAGERLREVRRLSNGSDRATSENRGLEEQATLQMIGEGCPNTAHEAAPPKDRSEPTMVTP